MRNSTYLSSLQAERDALHEARLIQAQERAEAERVARYKYERDSRSIPTVSEREAPTDYDPLDADDKFIITGNGAVDAPPPPPPPAPTLDRVELATWARANAHWCSFASDLLRQSKAGKRITDKQLTALNNIRIKSEASRAARAASSGSGSTAPTPRTVVDLSPIRRMFESAVEKGYKTPTFRAEGLIINRAPDTGRNPGCLYVKDEESKEYLGKVLGVQFFPSAAATSDTIRSLQTIAGDPLAAAVRFGRKTNRCACCGRELTNALSVELGIGPICRERWGL